MPLKPTSSSLRAARKYVRVRRHGRRAVVDFRVGVQSFAIGEYDLRHKDDCDGLAFMRRMLVKAIGFMLDAEAVKRA